MSAMKNNPFWRYGCDPSIPMLIPVEGISRAIINKESILIHASDSSREAYNDNPNFQYVGKGVLFSVGGKEVDTGGEIRHFWRRE